MKKWLPHIYKLGHIKVSLPQQPLPNLGIDTYRYLKVTIIFAFDVFFSRIGPKMQNFALVNICYIYAHLNLSTLYHLCVQIARFHICTFTKITEKCTSK